MRSGTAARGAALAAALTTVGAAAFVPGRVHLEGPPPGHTGAFGEPDCTVCHIGAPVNVPGGALRLEGLPSAWEPGARYVLSVVLESEEMGAAGFQLAARFARGDARGRSAGALEPVDARVGRRDGESGVAYAHQTPDGARPLTPERAVWSVVWVAPTGGGAVAFTAAANSGNGDNSPLSDLVYLFADTVPAGG